MDCSVRMNFSHGSYEYHQSVIDNTRKMVAGRSPMRMVYARTLIASIRQPALGSALSLSLSTRYVLIH